MSAGAIVVAGTDTGVGKTVVSAMLVLALDAAYWKPVQSGTAGCTDSESVRRWTGLGRERVLPEAYSLKHPLSPHRAAELDGVKIDPARLSALPKSRRPLVVELAGGLLVPWTREFLQVDALARWAAPVVLVSRTGLGAINHCLLSLEALASRRIPLLGLIFVGEAVPDSERTILEFSGARRLGRLPPLDGIDPAALQRAFRENFSAADFAFPIHA